MYFFVWNTYPKSVQSDHEDNTKIIIWEHLRLDHSQKYLPFILQALYTQMA